MPFCTLCRLECVSSTQDVAWQWAQRVPGPFAVWTDCQYAGRGRHGRQWHTVAGSVALSVFHPVQWPAHRIESLTPWLVRQLVARLQTAFPVIPWQIKPPNDILIQGQKVAGILTESRIRRGQAYAVVVGIGMNISQRPPIRHATALWEWLPTAQRISSSQMTFLLAEAIDAALRGFGRQG